MHAARAVAPVKRAYSSFGWPLRLLPPPQRAAMEALYDFCRAIDDIADETPDTLEAERRLDAWRMEIAAIYNGVPQTEQGRVLASAAQHFALPHGPFESMIDGMKMDVRGEMCLPAHDVLEKYCYCVAGCVGLQAVRIFGVPHEEHFALALAGALQFTNILRDLREDAARGRIYLPAAWCEEAGFSPTPATLFHHEEALTRVCARMAEAAKKYYADAEAHVTRHNRRALMPALLMRDRYRILLQELEAKNWQSWKYPRVTLSLADKLRIAARLPRYYW